MATARPGGRRRGGGLTKAETALILAGVLPVACAASAVTAIAGAAAARAAGAARWCHSAVQAHALSCQAQQVHERVQQEEDDHRGCYSPGTGRRTGITSPGLPSTGRSTCAASAGRAPVLTLWAAVVAERLGHPPDTALSLASAVAGTAAQAKARRLGLAEERDNQDGDMRDASAPRQRVRLLGKDIAMTADADGVVLAAGGEGKPVPAAPVRAYLAKAFGDRLADAWGAMNALARSLDPDELNRVGFRLYEQFRPEVPEGVNGWGAKGELRLDKIRDAAP